MREIEGKKKKLAEKSLRKAYGIGKLPLGLLMVNQRLRFVNKESLIFLKQMKAIRSVGIAVSGEELDVLTIEGGQLFKENIKKRIIEFDRKNAERWLAGKEIPIEKEDGLLIPFFKGHCLGSGHVLEENARTEIPKWRLIRAVASE
jgi:NOL1/NOP2/fmu family ribosome biogenesis protein